jgi:UDP-GlcNAc:undecaprenyl-phosphate GlcNAc-1-phosphate transferase
MSYITIVILSSFLSCFFVFLIRVICLKVGFLAKPRDDRWHRTPTPTLGGIGLFLAVLICVLLYANFSGKWTEIRWGVLIGSSIVFILGLYDDIRHLSPQSKLIGQFLAASVVVFLGYTTHFFTPRIENDLIAQFPNILLTFIWLIGITNAINLLDNMDGLASGISLITSATLSFFFWRAGDFGSLTISLALAGSNLGFLLFNFPPASIFMGDSGSEFLGFSLAVLAIARQPQASNVFAVLGVPTILFLLPIVDTVLVMVTRLLRGQSFIQGGRDHTSHRLIAFGLNERQAVLVLYGVAIVSGIVAIILESLDYDLSLVLVPILLISLALFTVYLGRIKVVSQETSTQHGTIMRFMFEMAYKRRLLEIVLDFFIIGIAYYLAFWTRFGLVLNQENLAQYLQTLPIILTGSYFSFFVFGVYHGVWRYMGLDNLLSFLKAVFGAMILSGLMIIMLYSNQKLYVGILVLFGIFLFLGLAATRSSFKIFDMFSNQQIIKSEERIFIYGVGDEGEMAVRWLLMNPQIGMRPIGFIDNQPMNIGRKIHGIQILGSLDQMTDLLNQKHPDGVVLAIQNDQPNADRIVSICQNYGCWVKMLSLEFKIID